MMNHNMVEWHRVEDCLPDKDGWYVVCADGMVMPMRFETVRLRSGVVRRWVYLDRVNFPWKVTHWTDVPDAPVKD